MHDAHGVVAVGSMSMEAVCVGAPLGGRRHTASALALTHSALAETTEAAVRSSYVRSASPQPVSSRKAANGVSSPGNSASSAATSVVSAER